MARIPFLVDENVPQEVTDFLRARGHTVFTVGEHLAKSSPDPLLITIAEELGLVVVTFDRDFRRLIRQRPRGSGRAVPRRAGRISLTCDETEARARIEAEIEVIEFHYDYALRQDRRLIMQISKTSVTIVT